MERKKGYNFGTTAVFLSSISTIFGAILFLRFGYAVANAGLLGTILIIFIAHLITIPTALAISEIATNMHVEGGGEYYIISRSFGKIIGGSIGISLYLARAISVAFYMIAFSIAFEPVNALLMSRFGFSIDLRIISLLFTAGIIFLEMWKGANIGIKSLWVVFVILSLSIVLFLFGKTLPDTVPLSITTHIKNPDAFFKVFAIVFPAFTGMAAGVGLSGDLKKPERSIPIGILSASITGMLVYIIVAIKLHISASPQALASDSLIMSKIAVWGPIIPIGLAAATLSSAIASAIVAPRILQALAKDGVLPGKGFNRFFSQGRGKVNEPINAVMVTAIIIFIFILPNSLDFVAQLITIFFIITYGILCGISFLEHIASIPSYRPIFHTKWYLSLIGGLMSIIIMFQIQPIYAILAILIMFLIYRAIQYYHKGERGLSSLFQGVIFQTTRWLKIISQRNYRNLSHHDWRPSVVAISRNPLERISIVEVLRWISYRYGFGTLIHFIKGFLTPETADRAKEAKNQLVKMVEKGNAGIYIDTIVSPSKKSAVAQIVQLSGVSGLDNNTLLMEFDRDNPENLPDITDAYSFAVSVGYNVLILRTSPKHFGYKGSIDVWITDKKYRNSNLMIILSYIIRGHPEWSKSKIRIFAAFPSKEIDDDVNDLRRIIESGRLPLSFKNIIPVSYSRTEKTIEEVIEEKSAESDLVFIGFTPDMLKKGGKDIFLKYPTLNEILFVSANQNILIV